MIKQHHDLRGFGDHMWCDLVHQQPMSDGWTQVSDVIPESRA